ncbi:MAG: hypothetical protein K2Y29_00795 [Beijerinckiaceae bacterium]|nr:hypothetical protein [Beijerinckiaceae bacterium]
MGKQPQSRTTPRETISPPSRDLKALPERVRAMRELILDAVNAGDIEELRPAIERNETLPIFASGPGRPRTFADVVEFLKRRSFDGQGRETLAIIAAIFDQPYVKITRGPSVTYEWPAFASAKIEAPGEDDLLAMYACTRFASLAASPESAPPVERIGVGADGTWHYFWSGA